MNKYYYLLISLLFILSCNGKNGSSDHSEEGHDGESAHVTEADNHGEEHDAEEIVFTPEQAKAAGLEIETVKAGDFREGIKTSGQILSAASDDETLVAKSNGILKLYVASLVEGAEVSSGQTLYTISSEGMSDGDVTNKAKIEYEAALKEYNRALDLLKDKLITQGEVNEMKLKVDIAKEAMKYGRTTTAASTSVAAPFRGFVKQMMAKNGSYVTAGTELITLTKNRRLQLRADVSEKYYSHLEHISGANFRLTGSDRTYNIEAIGGKLVSYGRSTAKDICFVPVVFEFDNTLRDIVAGSFCDVYMLGKHRQNVISVPKEALTEEQGLYYVYIQVDEEGYRKQEVELGETDGIRREITSGLSIGDKVVVKGATQVKLAGMSGAIPEHSHEH